ncbi:tyrosine-protein phosphatase [Rhodococcus sp. DMU1]|uniref:tyrosine-protein phosphatase n=1 Tax=Rhodococcus sp. DMU1 TaxID=2722825 RepID=UPI00143E68A8|nr:tyrosine-protein phosphatase [Rhodococcus sp. DMU1]
MRVQDEQQRVPGPVNLRDLGGLPLTDGGRTAPGVLYRGDACYTGDVVRGILSDRPPTTVVDLRSDAERGHRAFTWPDGTHVHRLSLHADAAPAGRTGLGLAELYGRVFDVAAPLFAGLVPVVARAAGPVLVHCTAGKDRTGLAVAVLLLAAGVEPQAVVDDYAATDTNMPLLLRRWEAVGLRVGGSFPGGDRAVPSDLFRAPAEAISPIVERLVAHPGGPGAWLIDHGAGEDEVRRWRARARGEDVAATVYGDRKAPTR